MTFHVKTCPVGYSDGAGLYMEIQNSTDARSMGRDRLRNYAMQVGGKADEIGLKFKIKRQVILTIAFYGA